VRFVRRKRLLLIALAFSASIVHAQYDLPSWSDRQLAIVERLDAIEESHGPNTSELISVLEDLAIALRTEGDHAAAATVVERTRQLIRINFGPHSLRQAPYIWQLIDYRERSGDFGNAWALENELLELAMRNSASVGSVPILRRIGDKRIEIFQRFNSGTTPPQIYFGCYYNWTVTRTESGECLSGSRREAIRAVVADAQRIYASAVSVLLDNNAFSSDELHRLEDRLIRSIYAYRNAGLRQGVHASNPFPILSVMWTTRMKPVSDLADWEFPESYFQESLYEARPRQRDGNRGEWHQMHDPYFVGRLSLQRQLAYAIETDSSLREQMTALVSIADWDLLHGRNGLAIQGYESAYRRLQAADDQSTLLTTLFNPEVPVALPTFQLNPLSAAEGSSGSAYIDVRFELSRFGRSRKVEVVARSSDLSDLAKSERARVVRRIKDTHFRPRSTDGRFVGSPSLVARYSISHEQSL
jgi:hypothetical protein